MISTIVYSNNPLESKYIKIANLMATYWGLIADVGNPKTPAPLASATIGNGDPPSPPKTCRRL